MLNEESKVISFGYKEILEGLREMKSQETTFNSDQIQYFYDVAKNYMFHEKVNDIKRVGILGLNIPEELIVACGAKPVWILGGSPDFAKYSDSVVSSDTDPVVKSLLGMLLSEQFPSFMNIDLLVIPAFSDSMKKAIDILSKEFNVLVVDIPQSKDGEYSSTKWKRQLKKMVKEICSLTGQKLKKDNLVQQTNVVIEAKLQIKRFITNYKKSDHSISNSLYVLILNSYFMTDDLNEWAAQLALLNDDVEDLYIAELKMDKVIRPNILLMGSSIFFPNMKIPTLLEKSKLNVVHIDAEMLTYLSTIPYIENTRLKNKIFESITDSYFESCVAQLYNNTAAMETLKNAILHSKIDGVVYHVLRGQDVYSIENIEKFFIKRNIPLLRIETDYNSSDDDKIKLEFESFGEMISEKITV